MSDKPLNPSLYRRLKRYFGHVKISNPGEAFVAKPTRGMQNEPRLYINNSGEYYLCSCPYCNDTRFRLYIHHMFGQKDAHGRRMTFMAICYNMNCLANPANKQDFLDIMDDTGDFLANAKINKGKIIIGEAHEVVMPGPFKYLSELKDTHKARAYLTSRNFNPDEVSKKFQVSFCLDSNYFLARERIIIPVLEKGKLKGWQARYIGELAWKDPNKKRTGLPPKYFSCPQSHFRSRCIYNFDEMKKWQTGIIVEGPTDVWRFGSMSGCLFGNTMTEHQRKKFLAIFMRRTAVLLLDPEEYNSRSTKNLIDYMTRRMPGRFCAVKLPNNTDPGSLDRAFLRDYVKEQALKQGIKVIYKKVI